MSLYIPTIQDRLRRSGYPVDASGVVQQIAVVANPGQSPQPQIITQQRDEFRDKDNTWSITIGEDMVALVTTAYTGFAEFRRRLEENLGLLDEIAELRLGRIHRIGLRYIDVIEPKAGENFRQYLQTSLHGPVTTVFEGSDYLHLEAIAKTKIGRFIVRLSQNDKGVLVPPDMIFRPMRHKQKPVAGRTITLVDSDHFVENQEGWDYDLASVLQTADELHGGINKAWFSDFITDHAKTAWGAERVAE
jgi:uncharacterized protein (TIGR04255 family)